MLAVNLAYTSPALSVAPNAPSAAASLSYAATFNCTHWPALALYFLTTGAKPLLGVVVLNHTSPAFAGLG